MVAAGADRTRASRRRQARTTTTSRRRRCPRPCAERRVLDGRRRLHAVARRSIAAASLDPVEGSIDQGIGRRAAFACLLAAFAFLCLRALRSDFLTLCACLAVFVVFADFALCVVPAGAASGAAAAVPASMATSESDRTSGRSMVPPWYCIQHN